MTLTGRQRRHLRALGHELKATLQVGKEGVSDALVGALGQLLTDHELVKVKIGQNAPLERHDAADELARRSKSEVAQVLGNAVLLYRPSDDEPAIALPGNSKKKPDAAAPPSKKQASKAKQKQKAARPPAKAPPGKKKPSPTAGAGAGGRRAPSPAARRPRRTP
jgi:RNA-binding protein